jgi:hypothetical protein
MSKRIKADEPQFQGKPIPTQIYVVLATPEWSERAVIEGSDVSSIEASRACDEDSIVALYEFAGFVKIEVVTTIIRGGYPARTKGGHPLLMSATETTRTIIGHAP